MSVFEDGQILKLVRFGDAGPGPKGGVMTVSFQVNGQEFTALNGGPDFQFSEAISFVVNCETQAEIDGLWERLPAGGGKEGRCGWLKDRYGLSWQVVPRVLPELLADADPARATRAMRAMMRMGKLDIAGLRAAQEAPT